MMPIILFILVVSIDGQDVEQNCEQALCFKDIDRCLYFAERINQQPNSPELKAHCRFINADPDSRWYL